MSNFDELLKLDEHELSSLVPKIGPRKRLVGYIKEKQGLKPASSPSSSAYGDLFAASFGEKSRESLVSEADAAYERGKNTATNAAREKMEQMKAVANEKIAALQAELDRSQQAKIDEVTQFKALANERFAALQDELEAEKTKNDNAKALVTKLKEQLRVVKEEQQSAADELAGSTEKSRQFVAQTRAREEEYQQTLSRERVQHDKAQQEAIKRALKAMYDKMTSKLQPNDVYHGAQVISLLEKAVKECYQTR